ncbi:sigma-70 family RNA polymerase sigma factor [Microbacterium sp.]|uniref:sigma-70 family RNA polymerase sigma factor n=1 Tax=Microbacterium sp. TaxID=51671 RepID=UPI003A95107D
MTVHYDKTSETEPAADADLILRTRSGDGEAFGELWRRHYPSGIVVARSVTSSIDPDDLVQESYARIYQAILKGGGPNGSFRAYLFTSIRNTAAAWGRARRETAMDELETVPDPDSTEQAADDALDRGLTAQAFRGLPTRWQEVLWYSEIEQMKPAEIAPLLGMKAGAVSQLAFRAREGLRAAWVQAHLRSTSSDSECHWTIERLGAYARGNVSTRDRARIDAHLDGCARCLIVAGEADEVSSRLALVLLPLVLGIAGASGYAAMLQTGGVPAVAVAAMPSSVVAGGVVVTGATPAGMDAAASAAASSSAGGGASGGAITSIGALVGAGSAALVVAGVVAAAAIIPGLLDASPVTSLPSAGDADSSSISSDVAPDGSIESKAPLVLDVPDKKTPKDAPDLPPQQPVAPPVTEEAPVKEASAPVDDEQPSDGAGNDGVEPTDPGDGGVTDPGDGGEVDPTEPTDPTDPTDPTEGATIGEVTWMQDGVHVIVPISGGVPGATLEAVINKGTGGSARTVLDSDGNGTLQLTPNPGQIQSDQAVVFQYLTDTGPTIVFTRSLHELRDLASTDSGDPAASDDQVVEDQPAAEQPVIDAQAPAAEVSAPEASVEESAEGTVVEEVVPDVPAEDDAPTEDAAPAE